MNKSELAAAMAEKSNLPQKSCQDALDAFVAVIEDVIKSGDKVKLSFERKRGGENV